MLCSIVYRQSHLRRIAAFASRMNLRDAAHSKPIPSRLPHASAPLPVTYSFRINTYKSVSKQRTLTPFRMNTYERQGEGGSMAFLARSLISTASFAHQGGLACHAQPRPLFLHPRVGEAAPARVRLPLRDSLLPVNARHHGGVTIHVRGHLVVGDLLGVQRFALRGSQELRFVLQRSVVIDVNQRARQQLIQRRHVFVLFRVVPRRLQRQNPPLFVGESRLFLPRPENSRRRHHHARRNHRSHNAVSLRRDASTHRTSACS